MFKFTPVDKLPGAALYKPTKNLKILEAFLKTGEKIVLFEGWTTATAINAQTSLQQSANRYKLGIDVACRDGKVYLMRRDV